MWNRTDNAIFGCADVQRYKRFRNDLLSFPSIEREDLFEYIVANEPPLDNSRRVKIPDPKMVRIFWNLIQEDLHKEIMREPQKLHMREYQWISHLYGPINSSDPVTNYTIPAGVNQFSMFKSWIRQARYDFLELALGEGEYALALEKILKDGRINRERVEPLLGELYRYHREEMNGEGWEDYRDQYLRRDALRYVEKWIILHGDRGGEKKRGFEIDWYTPYPTVFTSGQKEETGLNVDRTLVKDAREITGDLEGVDIQPDAVFEKEKDLMVEESRSGKIYYGSGEARRMTKSTGLSGGNRKGNFIG